MATLINIIRRAHAQMDVSREHLPGAPEWETPLIMALAAIGMVALPLLHWSGALR